MAAEAEITLVTTPGRACRIGVGGGCRGRCVVWIVATGALQLRTVGTVDDVVGQPGELALDIA